MTQTAQHTPGPWKTVGNWIVTSGNGRMMIDLHEADHDENQMDEAEANARLIAAAPETAAERDKLKAINAELLEALQRLLSPFKSDYIEGQVEEQKERVARGRAAIAKATGQ